MKYKLLKIFNKQAGILQLRNHPAGSIQDVFPFIYIQIGVGREMSAAVEQLSRHKGGAFWSSFCPSFYSAE